MLRDQFARLNVRVTQARNERQAMEPVTVLDQVRPKYLAERAPAAGVQSGKAWPMR
ncbi:MAG: hypothetical protein QNJ16_00235 [Rhodobacter sp.]|nr:hypothetical protein [Rhodobacter sp.]